MGFIVVRDGIVVQSIRFQNYRPVGRAEIAVEFFDEWGADEIVLVDISATRAARSPDFDMIARCAAHCRVPLTVGGGVSTLEDVRRLLASGADKVAFNRATVDRPELVTEAALTFGSQCVIASLDAIATPNGHYLYDYLHGRATAQTPASFAHELQERGAGEILINAVDRDGVRRGFDVALVQAVCAAVDIPVIACGGAGSAAHFIEIFQRTRASAAAAGNMLHYAEHSITLLKAVIAREIEIRHEVHADYVDAPFDRDGRLSKKSDDILSNLRFVRIEKEII